jgi:hypothetical protein
MQQKRRREANAYRRATRRRKVLLSRRSTPPMAAKCVQHLDVICNGTPKISRRVVDVFVQDRLIASSPVGLRLDGPMIDEDDVTNIKEQLLRTLPPDRELDRAKFIVRSFA